MEHMHKKITNFLILRNHIHVTPFKSCNRAHIFHNPSDNTDVILFVIIMVTLQGSAIVQPFKMNISMMVMAFAGAWIVMLL